MAKHSVPEEVVDEITSNLQAARAALEQAQEALEVKVLGGRVKRVNGSSGAAAPVPPTLESRIETLLRYEICSLDEVSKQLDVVEGKISPILTDMASRRQICNVGTEELPRWTWRIGDATPLKELTSLVERLITHQPMTTAELVNATGARAARVGGSIVDLQRSEVKILDVGGSPGRGRWFIVSAAARDAHLAPKAVKVDKKTTRKPQKP